MGIMKVDRDRLESNIEDVIANGVVEGEEIDITTKKVMEEIEMLIRTIEYYDAKQANEDPF